MILRKKGEGTGLSYHETVTSAERLEADMQHRREAYENTKESGMDRH